MRVHQVETGPVNHWLSDARINLVAIDIAQGKLNEAIASPNVEKDLATQQQDDSNLDHALYWLANANKGGNVLQLARELLLVLTRGGNGRAPLALDTNLLLAQRSADPALKQTHAARALSIANYMYGAEHLIT